MPQPKEHRTKAKNYVWVEQVVPEKNLMAGVDGYNNMLPLEWMQRSQTGSLGV